MLSVFLDSLNPILATFLSYSYLDYFAIAAITIESFKDKLTRKKARIFALIPNTYKSPLIDNKVTNSKAAIYLRL